MKMDHTVKAKTLEDLAAVISCSAPADYMVQIAIDRLEAIRVAEKDDRGFEPCPWHRNQYPVLLVTSTGEGRKRTYNVVARCDACFVQRVVMVPASVVKRTDDHHDAILKLMMSALQEGWNWNERK